MGIYFFWLVFVLAFVLCVNLFLLVLSLAVHGVEVNIRVNVLGPHVRPSMEEDFLHTYPVMSVSGLNSLVEDGTFVVCATVVGLVDDEDWWYPACKCHKSVTPDSGAYYCGRCVKHVFQMIPRFVFFFHVLLMFFVLSLLFV
jgi:hypothetical protein